MNGRLFQQGLELGRRVVRDSERRGNMGGERVLRALASERGEGDNGTQVLRNQ